MKAKLTQKRGRRTDSISLDIEELNNLQHPDFSVKIDSKDELFDVEISLLDITMTVTMDARHMKTLGEALQVAAPSIMQFAHQIGDEEVSAMSEFNQGVSTMSNLISDNKEECTPCQMKAQEHLRDYFKRLIDAYDNDPSSVDASIRDNIGKINNIYKGLSHIGTSAAKQAYDEAVDFLSDFP